MLDTDALPPKPGTERMFPAVLILTVLLGFLHASTPLSAYDKVIPKLDEEHSYLSIVHGMAHWRGCRFAQALTLQPWKWIEKTDGDQIVFKPDPISELVSMLFGAVQNTTARREVQPTRKKEMPVTHMNMDLIVQILIKTWRFKRGECVYLAEEVINLCMTNEHFMNSVKEANLEMEMAKRQIQEFKKSLRVLQNPTELKSRIGSLSGILHGNKHPVAQKILSSINSLNPFDKDDLHLLRMREDRHETFMKLAEELKRYDEFTRPNILQLETDLKMAEQKTMLMANEEKIMANLEKFSRVLAEACKFTEKKLYRYNTPLALIQAYIFARWPLVEDVEKYYAIIKKELPEINYSYGERNAEFDLASAPLNLSTAQLEAMALEVQTQRFQYSDISSSEINFNNVKFSTCMEVTTLNAILSASFSAEKGIYTDERASEMAKKFQSNGQELVASMQGLVGPWYMKVAKENNANGQYYALNNNAAIAFIHRRGLPKTAKKIKSITMNLSNESAEFEIFSIPKDGGDLDNYERVLAVFDDGMVRMELLPHPRNLLYFMVGEDRYSPDTSLADLSKTVSPTISIISTSVDSFFVSFETDDIAQRIELTLRHGSNKTFNKMKKKSDDNEISSQSLNISEASNGEHVEANFLFAQPKSGPDEYGYLWKRKGVKSADLTSTLLNLDFSNIYNNQSFELILEWITDTFGDTVSLDDMKLYFERRNGLKKHVAMFISEILSSDRAGRLDILACALFDSLSLDGQLWRLGRTWKFPGISERLALMVKRQWQYKKDLSLTKRLCLDVARMTKGDGREDGKIMELFPWLHVLLEEGGNVLDLGYCRRGKEWTVFAAFPGHVPTGCDQYAYIFDAETDFKSLERMVDKRWRDLQSKTLTKFPSLYRGRNKNGN